VNGVERVLERADPRWVFPATPSLDDAVLARIAAPPRRHVRRRWVVAAVAAAVLVLAAATVAGRSVVDWIGLGGTVELRWADELPATSARRPFHFGRRVTLERARELAPYRLRVPSVDDLDRPTAVYHRQFPPGDMVTFVYEAEGRPRLILSQWQSRASRFEKVLPHATAVVPVDVAGSRGLWVGGGGHAVYYRAVDDTFPRERFALAAHTLIWRRGRVSYRLEAAISRAEALRIAGSLR
jgi:hypothetical protein